MVRKIFSILSLAAATIFSVNAATVRGVVEDDTRNPNPIEDAVVSFTSTGAGPTTEYRDTTNANGEYRVTIDENGTYDIAVTKAGYTPGPNNDQSVRITTGTGTVVLDFTLIAREVGTTVSGAVTDSLTNAFLIGVKLLLQQSAMSTWRTIDSTASGTSGAYTFDSVSSGSYRIQASILKYVTKNTSLTVSAAPETLNIKLVAVETAKISGTITDSLSNANLAGAQLILQQSSSGTWRTVDTVASAGGAYAFDSLVAGTYRIQASLTGYTSKTTANITVSGTQPVTMNITLVAVQTGKITGKVTGDSANGAAISGATVILEKVSGTVTAMDTETTNANGVYLFPTVEAGLNYDVTVSKTGYNEKIVRHSRQTAGTDTVNIFIVKIATGSFYVKAMKQADSAAIVGASVMVTATGGVLLTGTTGSNGIAAFEDLVVTPTYNITISAAGFIIASRANYRLAANVKDTVKFFMSAATSGTKVLTGTVTDSSSKAAVTKARVTLTLQGGITLIDSTDATGKFSISGIPATVYQGSVAATCNNYRSYSNSLVTIGQPNQADTGRLNIIMVKVPTEIIPHVALSNVPSKPGISVAGAARLKLCNFNENGVASLFNMNGKVVYRTKIVSHATMLMLPANITGGPYIVTITQKNAVYRQQVIMP